MAVVSIGEGSIYPIQKDSRAKVTEDFFTNSPRHKARAGEPVVWAARGLEDRGDETTEPDDADCDGNDSERPFPRRLILEVVC